MTTKAIHAKAGCKPGGHAPAPSPKTVSLKVVPDKSDPLHIKKSRSSRWRAAVLILVNLLMVAHFIQWRLSPTHATISPVEPSESMYTLETGTLNAGFIFFAAALLATFVFGRFFCGWGCHIVALQDLCSHIMNKLGVRPKPFRSRVLLLGPLLLALYMFAWVPFKRLALVPLFQAIKWGPPSWLVSNPGRLPPMTTHLIITEFWKTFPSWFVAVPFLLICGFATVYFLGSKGFCTYACPYGGFFAPMDKISIGRIVVSDACEGCGHCTAVCTSNVRVHQEVRDFGMVVDPGCMKCLDCVSVCPNDALSFSFARPAVMAKARTAEAIAGQTRRPDYDLTLGQDLLLLAFTIVLFIAYRGMFFVQYKGELGVVPLLMAAGMASIGTFAAWKLWTIFTQPSVRLQSLQLRHKGRLKPAGFVFAVATLAYLGLAPWSGAVHAAAAVGSAYDDQIAVPTSAVFSPGYVPGARDKENATAALKWIERAGPIRAGGFGWPYTVETNQRRAWLYSVAGDFTSAERCQRDAINGAKIPFPIMVFDLGRIMIVQGKPVTDVLAMYREVLAEHPTLHPVRLELANAALQQGNADQAVKLAEEVGAAVPAPEAFTMAQAASLLMDAKRVDRAAVVLEAALARYPDNGLLHAENSRVMFFTKRPMDAVIEMKRACELEPNNPAYLYGLAELLDEMGREGEAQDARRRAAALEAAMSPRR